MSATTRWRSLLPAARGCLMACANVTGVGLGRGNSAATSQELVWRVYIGARRDAISSSASISLPALLFGLPVEVFSAEPGWAAAKTPTVYTAGMQIESKINGSGLTVGSSEQGALGCFAKDSAGKPVLLTNSHVMFPHFLALSHLGVYQPDYSSCCSGGDKIATAVFDPAKVKDGKFKGGFNEKPGFGVIPAGNDKGFTKSGGQLNCSEMDCAIARLDPGVHFKNVLPTSSGEIAINGVNEDVLSVLGPAAGKTPMPDQYVRIVTPRGGGTLIYGTLTWRATEEITSTSIVVNGTRLTPIFNDAFVIGSPEDQERAGSLPTINQFVILPRPKPIPGEADYTKFYASKQDLSFDFGDSGSVVIDHLGRVIAQIIGGFPFVPDLFVKRADRANIEFTSVRNVAIASPIGGILEQLKITVPAAGFAGTVPSAAAGPRVSVPGFRGDNFDTDRQIVDGLRERLRSSRRGKLVLGKIAQHRREIRNLLERVRALSVAWRELQGPAFYHHSVESARHPGHVIPTSINGVTRERLVQGLAPLFLKHGSAALNRDLTRYRAWAKDVIVEIATVHDFPASVTHRRPTA